MDAKLLNRKFCEDIDHICRDLIKTYGLRYSQEAKHLSSPLDRWLDFRFRYVDPQPRRIVLSDNFPKIDLPESARRGLERLIKIFERGGDVNPYQGRGLILRNDFSRQEGARTDLLYADWGILHFHLTTEPLPPSQYFSMPADYLAFCIVGGDVVAIVDVLPHPDAVGFANLDLIETVHRCWPDFMEPFRLTGLLPGGHHSSKEVHALRSKGANSSLTLGGSSYMSPGMGLTTAATPLRVAMAATHVYRWVDVLAQIVSHPTSQYIEYSKSMGVTNPIFSLEVVHEHGLVVFETGSDTAFGLPSPRDMESLAYDLRNLISPAWAIGAIESGKIR